MSGEVPSRSGCPCSPECSAAADLQRFSGEIHLRDHAVDLPCHVEVEMRRPHPVGGSRIRPWLDRLNSDPRHGKGIEWGRWLRRSVPPPKLLDLLVPPVPVSWTPRVTTIMPPPAPRPALLRMANSLGSGHCCRRRWPHLGGLTFSSAGAPNPRCREPWETSRPARLPRAMASFSPFAD